MADEVTAALLRAYLAAEEQHEAKEDFYERMVLAVARVALELAAKVAAKGVAQHHMTDDGPALYISRNPDKLAAAIRALLPKETTING